MMEFQLKKFCSKPIVKAKNIYLIENTFLFQNVLFIRIQMTLVFTFHSNLHFTILIFNYLT